MSSAVQLRVVPPVVEFDATYSVVLLCAPDQQRTASDLAESLLAMGFDACVVHDDLHGLRALQGERPALFVPMTAHYATPAFRGRVRQALGRAPLWLDGEIATEAFVLMRRIQARLDDLERERTGETPLDPGDEAEASAPNVIPLVTAASPTGVRRHAPMHVVLWPLLGAALTALGMLALLPGRAEDARVAFSAITQAVELEVAEAPVAAAMAPAAPKRAPAPQHASVPPPPKAVPTEPPAAEQGLLDNEHVTATDDFLVYLAPDRSRDWYAAMDLCRGRTHAGVEGWTTPSSRQLHALAAARALPEVPLWSRTRSAHSKDVAFVVHGKVGNARSTEKTESLSAAVCIRKRHEGPAGD